MTNGPNITNLHSCTKTETSYTSFQWSRSGWCCAVVAWSGPTLQQGAKALATAHANRYHLLIQAFLTASLNCSGSSLILASATRRRKDMASPACLHGQLRLTVRLRHLRVSAFLVPSRTAFTWTLAPPRHWEDHAVTMKIAPQRFGPLPTMQKDPRGPGRERVVFRETNASPQTQMSSFRRRFVFWTFTDDGTRVVRLNKSPHRHTSPSVTGFLVRPCTRHETPNATATG